MSRSDDAPTVIAISLLAAMLADVLHEGVGHALVALTTVAQSGVWSTVAWSSQYDSRLVAAGGTLVNLVAGALFWIVLRVTKSASPQLRLFLLLACAFNLFTGTGYFFFSGVTNFGDWAVVILGMNPYWLWRVGLIVVGMTSYYGSVVLIGIGMVQYIGIAQEDRSAWPRLTVIPYLSALGVIGVAGLMNPIGIQLVWQSALPATAGANCGFLWMRYYVPEATGSRGSADDIGRSYAWIIPAVLSSLIFVFVLGRGITLQR